MSKITSTCLGSILLFACATPLLAQDGCLESPENPTVILAIVGSAGALFSTLRYRAKRNR